MYGNRKILSKEFVDSIDRVAKSGQLAGEWPVYRDFEVEEKGEEVYVYALFRPEQLDYSAGPIINTFPKDLNLRRRYAPLREEPDLFLKFASLARKGPLTKNEAVEVMLDWVKSYGTLGWGSIYYLEAPGSLPQEMHRRECLSAFTRAVAEAARCLGSYQAARMSDVEAVGAVLQQYPYISGGTAEQRRETALQTVGEHVGGHVRSECYPELYREFNKETKQTVGFSQGWDFHSLLGAMYFQMMQLITKGITIRACKGPGCPHFIRYDIDRKDKEFCSKNCKEKWRYHHVVKPRKQRQA